MHRHACMPSHLELCLFATLWNTALQAPLSMEFSRQEYWSGLPCPSPGNLPNPGIKAVSLMSPALAGGFFITSATREAGKYTRKMHKHYHPAQPIDPTSDITDLSYSPHISSSIVFPDLYTPTLKDYLGLCLPRGPSFPTTVSFCNSLGLGSSRYEMGSSWPILNLWTPCSLRGERINTWLWCPHFSPLRS